MAGESGQVGWGESGGVETLEECKLKMKKSEKRDLEGASSREERRLWCGGDLKKHKSSFDW